MGSKARKSKWQRAAEAALTDSIAHWEHMYEHGASEDHRPTSNHCACCKEFFDCIACPVAEETGIGECYDSPWGDASLDLVVGMKKTPHIEAEVLFLKGLLRKVRSGELRPSRRNVAFWKVFKP